MKKWIEEIGIQVKKGAGGVGKLTNEEADKVIDYCIKKWQEFGMSKIDIATGIALINVESGFNCKAKCPSSTAQGLGQFLNNIWKEAVDNANKAHNWDIDATKTRMDFETQVIVLGKRIQDTLAPRTKKIQNLSSFSGFKYPEILYSIHHDWNAETSSSLLKGTKKGEEKVYASLKPIFLDTYNKVYNEIIKEGNFTPQENNSTTKENETSNLKKVNPDNTSSKKSDATVKSNSSGKIVIKDYNPLDFKLQVPEYVKSDGSIKQIDDTSSNSNIKELGLSITNKFVCEGATTSCTLGISIGKLTSIENKIFKIDNKKVITILDNKIGNIGTFGNCKKTSPPSPCGFALKENWNKYDSYFGIEGNAFGKIALTNFFITEKSQCKCVNGGVISIIQPEQEFVGNSRGFNKEESTIIKSDEISKSEKSETKTVAKKTEVKKNNTTYEKNNCNIQKYNKVEKHKILGELRYRNTGGGRIEIDPNWVKNNIISYNIPLILHKKFPKTIYIHKKSYNNWNNVFSLFIKNIELLNCVISFDGVWVPRHIRWDDNKGLSNHTWGLAIDINAGKYPMGVKIDETNTDNIQVKLWNNIFRPAGFSWGNSYKDAMHFEILKL